MKVFVVIFFTWKATNLLQCVLFELQKVVTALTMILCVCFDLLTHMCYIHFTTLLPLWETEMRFWKFCISILSHNHYWYIDTCLIFKYSIQRSEFDRCANLAQSGGTFSTADGANLTLLVRQLLFFYRQNEDSKRLVSTVTYFDL